jgi:hypothetical protein
MDSGLVLRTPRNDGSGCQAHSQLPVGQITKFLSSPSRKNIPLNLSGKSKLESPPSRTRWRGVSRSSRTLGAGCDGRGSVGRVRCSQGGFRERVSARRRPALKRLRQDFFRQHMSRSKRSGGGSRGRQKRVVLAPVAGVKLMEIFRTQPGFDRSSIRQRWRQDEFVSRESAP